MNFSFTARRCVSWQHTPQVRSAVPPATSSIEMPAVPLEAVISATTSEARGGPRQHLFQRHCATRTSNVAADITGPQFRFEERRSRNTDPLMPVYTYDGGAIDPVRTRRPPQRRLPPRPGGP